MWRAFQAWPAARGSTGYQPVRPNDMNVAWVRLSWSESGTPGCLPPRLFPCEPAGGLPGVPGVPGVTWFPPVPARARRGPAGR